MSAGPASRGASEHTSGTTRQGADPRASGTTHREGGQEAGTGAVALSPPGAGLPASRGTRLALAALRGSRRSGGPLTGVAVGVLLVLLLQGNGFTSTLIVDMLVYAIAAMSLDFLGEIGRAHV